MQHARNRSNLPHKLGRSTQHIDSRAPLLVPECFEVVGKGYVADAVEGKPLEFRSHRKRLFGVCALANEGLELMSVLQDSLMINVDI